MSLSLFAKVREITLGNLHEILDSMAGETRIPIIKQRLRDLEVARDGIAAQRAMAVGRVATLETNVSNIAAEMATAESQINLLITDNDDSNDAVATTLQIQLNALKARKQEKENDLVDAKKLRDGVSTALDKIRARHDEGLARVQQLEDLDRSAKANEQAADALEKVADLSNIDAPSLDGMAEKVQARAATAKARLDQAFGAVTADTSTADTVALAQAKADIAARKAELGKQSAAA